MRIGRLHMSGKSEEIDGNLGWKQPEFRKIIQCIADSMVEPALCLDERKARGNLAFGKGNLDTIRRTESSVD
jgi:hypothetical protein